MTKKPAPRKGKPRKKGAVKKAGRGGNHQAFFVDEYMKDQNGTAAAIRAGYATAGAGVTACRLLKIPKIRAEIDSRLAELSASKGIAADAVMQEYANIALLDPLDVFNPDGTLKPLDQMSAGARRAIASIEFREVKITEVGGDAPIEIHSQVKKIKFNSKLGALDSVAQILGMMREAAETQVNVGVTIVAPDRFETVEEWQKQAGK